MSGPIDLPRDMRQAVTKEFQGERILWTGRPSPVRTFLAASLLWIIAIPWTVFSIGWEWIALGGVLSKFGPEHGVDAVLRIVFPLFGLPFVLVGLGMMAVPIRGWWQARNTVYVCGDKRLSVLILGRRRKVTSYPLGWVTRVERTEGRDGSGTLKLVMGSTRDSDGDKIETTETLTGIPEVRNVERLVWEHGGAGRLR